MTPVCIISLIHGTFARNAPWTDPSQSTFVRTLRCELRGPIAVYSPTWSARNRHPARLAAAQEIGAQLAGISAKHPGVPHFVIGHSHGGTVLALALRDFPELRERLSGYVFLSTPFIQVRDRARGAALLLPFFLSLMLTVYVPFIPHLKPTSSLCQLKQFESLSTFIFAPTLVVAYFLFFPSSSLPRWLQRRLSSIKSQFAISGLDCDKTLFVRANADEASAALSFFQFLNRLLGDILGLISIILWRPLFQAVRCYEVRPLLLVVIACFFLREWAIIGSLRWLLGAPPQCLAFALTSINNSLFLFVTETFSSALYGLYVSSLVILAVGLFLGLLARTLIGAWLFPYNLFLDVSVEPVPPGTWHVTQIAAANKIFDIESDHIENLAHSESYKDKTALFAICQFISERLK